MYCIRLSALRKYTLAAWNGAGAVTVPETLAGVSDWANAREVHRRSTSMSGRIRVLLVEFNLLRNTPLRYPVPLPRIQNGGEMRTALLICTAAFAALPLSYPASAQQTRPQIETRKVEGTDGVYIFRNGNHQSIFIVTKDGVIATDPIAYGRPTGGQQYVDEIKKVTDKPIKFLIYSHHHYDHIAGGKPFKDAGATIIAHKNVKVHLAPLADPNTVLPDESFDGKKIIKLGGTTLELHYLGLNHSDSNIVMRLPKEKIIFVVDTIPVGTFPGRGFIDIFPLETE